MESVNLIGPGRVGETLLRCLMRADGYVVQDICSRRFERASSVVQRLNVGRAVELSAMKAADIWLVAVPDGDIHKVAADLAECDVPPSAVVHFSGFHGANIMAQLADRGWHIASAHPNLSFANPDTAAENFAGTLVGVEGSGDGVETVERLLRTLGARTFPLNSESKVLYHSAAVFSNNFTTVVQAIAHQIWAQAGLSDAAARELSANLLRAATENVVSLGPAAALTGPAARGDADVVRAETDALSDLDTNAGQLYAVLSKCADRLKRTGTPFDLLSDDR